MRIVGLTGGISSGKSTVSNLFKVQGIPVVDADIVARDVLKKGSGGWRKVVAAFGNEILLDNGEVDRAKLGQIVFSDPGKRQLLNRFIEHLKNLSPEVVVASGVPCCRLIQNPGEFVVTFPRAYHVGFSHGFNCGEAANFGTPQWLKIAKEAAVRRATMNNLPMLSHQKCIPIC